jgi:hypothetical protein
MSLFECQPEDFISVPITVLRTVPGGRFCSRTASTSIPWFDTAKIGLTKPSCPVSSCAIKKARSQQFVQASFPSSAFMKLECRRVQS